MSRPAFSLALALICAAAGAGPLQAVWTREAVSQDLGGAEQQVAPDDAGAVVFERGSPYHSRLVATVHADLSASPWLVIDAHAANAQWRMSARLGDGPEAVVLDHQVAGVARVDLRRYLGNGSGPLALAMYLWGWGGGNEHYVRFTPSLEPAGTESRADALLGEMAAWHRRAGRDAEQIHLAVQGHPRLRFNEANRDRWRSLAAEHPELAQPLTDIIADLDAHRAEEPYVLTAESRSERRPAWGANLLSVRPPQPPDLGPGLGADPFPGLDAWRELYWHDFSHWLLGACLCDDPVFVEQARRWALALVRHRFWLRPQYRYFDFGTSYPLQCLCTAYDISSQAMLEGERADVRDAIATLAHGLYLNAISGHGSIYNDLRGNHTSVTMCGLGMAGLTLLGEDERAPLWVALARRFMLDCFEEHTSGGWLESPSYGAYGVSEWVRLAEMLRNVTGEDDLGHPFLRRFAEFQLHVSDWEGRDLGYNGGGAGEYWNQWVFHAIAREFQDPRFQWLGHPTEETPAGAGYGDRFWWVDPDLPAERPAQTDTGRHFADIGVSVWRSGWGDDATILLHHCGMKGQHKEENMNHVTLYALGRRFLPDGVGGRTADHNVPVIDERIQNRWMPGRTLAYHCDARSGYALGDTRHAYSGSRRHVLLMRPDLVVLIDELNLGERDDHAVRFMLHPSGECSVAGEVLTVRSGDASLQALTALPGGTVLPMTAQEREQPRRATHDAWALYRGRGALRAITFLLISPTPDPPAPTLEATATGLRLRHGEREFVLGLQAGEVAQGFATNADLWLARLRDGQPQAILVPGAAEMGDTLTELVTPAGAVSGSPTVSWGR